VQAVLNKKNVSLGDPHSQWWLEETFYDAFSKKVAVHCSQEHHAHRKAGKAPVWISEVWMCFDRQMQPFDCPDNIRRKCGADVIFPTLPPNSPAKPGNAWNPGDFTGPGHQKEWQEGSDGASSGGNILSQVKYQRDRSPGELLQQELF
jgi:hypothetical protein